MFSLCMCEAKWNTCYPAPGVFPSYRMFRAENRRSELSLFASLSLPLSTVFSISSSFFVPPLLYPIYSVNNVSPLTLQHNNASTDFTVSLPQLLFSSFFFTELYFRLSLYSRFCHTVKLNFILRVLKVHSVRPAADANTVIMLCLVWMKTKELLTVIIGLTHCKMLCVC